MVVTLPLALQELAVQGEVEMEQMQMVELLVAVQLIQVEAVVVIDHQAELVVHQELADLALL